MKNSMRRIAAAAVLVLGGGFALGACTTGAGSAADNSVQSVAEDGTPIVDRSGNGNFPKVEGNFGEDPTISAGEGEANDRILAKTLNQGDGEEVGLNDIVTVNYEGALWDGTVFDSSFERGESVSFSLNGVIQGWKYGLATQKVGDRVELVIPATWAYGEQGSGSIPAGATLTFVVDILATTSGDDLSALSSATPTGESTSGVTINGELAAEPTLTFEGEVPTTKQVILIAEGTGAALEASDTVLIHGVATIWGTDEVSSTWQTGPVTGNAANYGLTGYKVGSRVLIINPIAATEAQSGVEATPASAQVLVIDIIELLGQ